MNRLEKINAEYIGDLSNSNASIIDDSEYCFSTLSQSFSSFFAKNHIESPIDFDNLASQLLIQDKSVDSYPRSTFWDWIGKKNPLEEMQRMPATSTTYTSNYQTGHVNINHRLVELLNGPESGYKFIVREVIDCIKHDEYQDVYSNIFLISVLRLAQVCKLFPRFDAFLESCPQFVQDIWNGRLTFENRVRATNQCFMSDFRQRVSKYLDSAHQINFITSLCSIALVFQSKSELNRTIAGFGLTKAISNGFVLECAHIMSEDDLDLIDMAVMLGRVSSVSFNDLAQKAFILGCYEQALRFSSVSTDTRKMNSEIYDRCLEYLGLFEDIVCYRSRPEISELEYIIHECSFLESDSHAFPIEYTVQSCILSRLQHLNDQTDWTDKHIQEVLLYLKSISKLQIDECGNILDQLLAQHPSHICSSSGFWKAYILSEGVKKAESKIKKIVCCQQFSGKLRLMYTRYVREPLEHPFDQIMSDFEECMRDPNIRGKATVACAKYLDRKMHSNTSTDWVHLKQCLDMYLVALSEYGKLKLVVAPRILTLLLLNEDRFAIQISKFQSALISGFQRAIPYHTRSCIYLVVSLKNFKNPTLSKISTLLIRSSFSLYPNCTSWYCMPLKNWQDDHCDDILQMLATEKESSELWSKYCWLAQNFIKVSKCRDNQIQELLSSLKFFDSVLALPDYNLLSLHQEVLDEENISKVTGIAEYFEIMRSLQKPKKIWFVSSSGHKRPFLCKLNDEIRKDNRVLAFLEQFNALNPLNNSILLNVYAAIPLTDSTGLIEWVDNTKTLRSIINAYLLRKKVEIDMNQAKSLLNSGAEGLRKLQEMYPCVLHEFYHESFIDAKLWLLSKKRYTFTLATMSMMGFLIGLGDRHTENILISSNNGSILHVDYSCVFDKAKEFEIPEVVPFRLTQNLVKILLNGRWNGTQFLLISGGFVSFFAKSLEKVQKYHDEFLSLLESFFADPLLEWKKVNIQKRKNVDLRKFVSYRINGCWKESQKSCSAQVVASELAKLASDDILLASMYYGWAPFI